MPPTVSLCLRSLHSCLSCLDVPLPECWTLDCVPVRILVSFLAVALICPFYPNLRLASCLLFSSSSAVVILSFLRLNILFRPCTLIFLGGSYSEPFEENPTSFGYFLWTIWHPYPLGSNLSHLTLCAFLPGLFLMASTSFSVAVRCYSIRRLIEQSFPLFSLFVVLFYCSRRSCTGTFQGHSPCMLFWQWQTLQWSPC